MNLWFFRLGLFRLRFGGFLFRAFGVMPLRLGIGSGGLSSRGFAGLGYSQLWFFLKILDDQRNSAVRGVKRISGFAQALVRETTNLRDLIHANALLLH